MEQLRLSSRQAQGRVSTSRDTLETLSPFSFTSSRVRQVSMSTGAQTAQLSQHTQEKHPGL